MNKLARDIIVERLEKDLLGPAETEEIISEKPSDKYLLAILSPENTKIEAKEDDDKLETEIKGDVEERSGDERVSIIKTYKPSSIGLSFSLKTDEKFPKIKVAVSFGTYTDIYLDKDGNEIPLGKEKKSDLKWRRKENSTEISIILDKAVIHLSEMETKINKLGIFIKRFWEKTNNKWSVTLAVINRNKSVKDGEDKTPRFEIEKMSFFQSKVKIEPINCYFVSRTKKFVSDDEDSKNSSLIYRNINEYATGHTCSADWDGVNDPTFIFSSWLPKFIVKSTDSNGDEIFNNYLGKENDLLSITNFVDCNQVQLEKNLNLLVEAYSNWLIQNKKIIETLEGKLREQALKNIQVCEQAISRMKEGIDLVTKNEECFFAFKLANETMQKQYNWTNKSTLKWRPFQIAFFLLTLTSLVKPDHKDRNTLDLLWFPTGGGKTEAYLLISAFIIFFRRMRLFEKKKFPGIAIIMRYTLRTLTVQQFQRACKMIVAAEIIRKKYTNKIKGEEKFSIGLWVGDAATPNRLDVAIQKLDTLDGSSPVQIEDCPCCNKKLQWNPTQKNDDIIVSCKEKSCELNNLNNLPIMTCDELIYRKPPSLLIGTIDKFAQITRNKNIRKLFGIEDSYNPPELIIQDELHLISGPLGTLSALYEIAVDSFCSRIGYPPKIIGSTATIRMAKEQVLNLFERKTFQFPPPVIDASNSCFSKTDERSEGRLYLGISTTGRTAKFVLQAVCASLLQSVNDNNLHDVNKDPYSSLIVYFNALRDLGGSLVMMEDDVPKAMGQFSERRNEEIRKISAPEELTSRKSQTEVRKVMRTLERNQFGDPECIDVLLATNMLSVGVDIGRLGLIVVNGQPKTMSEYIQSTSRIGREHPGIVVTIYNNNKNRDKSHFETFRTWHQSLYKDIEATSVTPFAPRARDKALHAVIVALARQLYKEFSNPNINQDSQFSSEKKIEILKNNISKIILNRVKKIDERELDDTKFQINNIIEKWKNASWAKKYWSDYNYKNSLLISAEMAAERQAAGKEKLDAWPTPNSMRDVEPECEFMIWREKEY